MSIKVMLARESGAVATKTRPIGPPKSVEDEVDALDPEGGERFADEAGVARR